MNNLAQIHAVPQQRCQWRLLALPGVAVTVALFLVALFVAGCGSTPVLTSTTSVAAGSSSTAGAASSTTTAAPASSDLFPVQSGEEWGYVDQAGRLIIGAQFGMAEDFDEGLAAVWVDDKWGYIDSSGRFAISPRFARAGPFSGGLATVSEDLAGPLGFIDKSGTFVVEPLYDELASFTEGLAAVRKGAFWGFIDPSGKVVIPISFEDVGSFTEGLTRAKAGGAWGYIDHSGKFAIKPQYASTDLADPPALHFHSGLAAVYVNGAWMFIDKTGRQAFPQTFFAAGEFSEGLAPVEVNILAESGATDYRMGFVDPTGKMVIAPEFTGSSMTIRTWQIAGFHGGLAAVSGEYPATPMGYIDKTGKFVIEPQFDLAYAFDGPVARAEVNGLVIFIDQTGKIMSRGGRTESSSSD